MTVIWINLAAVYIASFFSRYLAKPNPLGAGSVPIKPNRFMVFIVMLVFVMVAGLRKNIGDTFGYMLTYSMADFSWEYILGKKEIGFGVLQKILKLYSSDPQVLVFTTALITNVLIVYVLYKYSRLFELSIYLYITSGLFIVSMNGIRQFLASAIIFAAIKYIFDGNWKKYFLVVILAATIHQSAFILMPIYFIIRRKAWTLPTFVLLTLTIFLVIAYNQFSQVLFSLLENTSYGKDYKDLNEGGANYIRVAVYAIPLIIAFIGRERLRAVFPKIDYVVNLSIISLVFMIISTQNWIYARFTIYFGLYNLILLSWIIKIFPKRQQMLMYYVVVAFYFIYFFYENAVVLNIKYLSDYIKFPK
jgi:transmembrane protein EpsG